jgi:hypothetical protein
MSRPADDRLADREAKAAAVRAAMPPDMLTLTTELRDLLDCRLTYLKTPTLTVGKPDQAAGYCVADMVLESVPTDKAARGVAR